MAVDWGQYTPIGKQTGLSVAGSAVTLTVPSGAKPRAALLQVQTAPIRFWTDNSTPTSSQGIKAVAGDCIELASNAEIVNFKAIRESATSATLEVIYYG